MRYEGEPTPSVRQGLVGDSLFVWSSTPRTISSGVLALDESDGRIAPTPFSVSNPSRCVCGPELE